MTESHGKVGDVHTSRRHRIVGAAGAIGAVAALAIAGCGSSGSGGSGSSPAHSASHPTGATIERAAYVSAGEPGYKVALSLNEQLGSAGSITASGSGTFSTTAKAGTLSMAMNVPGAMAGLGKLNLSAIIRGSDFYIKLPAQLSSLIPGGKPWLFIDLQEMGKVSGIPGLGSLVSSEGSLSDPGQYLSYLHATSPSGVTDLGTQTVNGVSTTHYRATLDLTKLPDVVPAADRASAEQFVAALQAKDSIGTSPIDVWIDAQQRVRRIVLNYSVTPKTGSAAGKTVSIAMTENFLDYGAQPTPAAPATGDTTNLLSVLHGL